MRFLLGFGIGLGLAILFAPVDGEELRRRLAHKAHSWMRLPSRKIEQITTNVKERAGEVGARVGRQAAEAAVEGVASDILGTGKAV